MNRKPNLLLPAALFTSLCTNAQPGTWRQAGNGKPYTIESSGTLYEVNVY